MLRKYRSPKTGGPEEAACDLFGFNLLTGCRSLAQHSMVCLSGAVMPLAATFPTANSMNVQAIRLICVKKIRFSLTDAGSGEAHYQRFGCFRRQPFLPASVASLISGVSKRRALVPRVRIAISHGFRVAPSASMVKITNLEVRITAAVSCSY